MAVICTKCGSTDVLCEALVNPNTEKVVSYHDGAFMYGFCENCKDESVITDTNGIKCDMEISYLKFCKVEKKEPDYAECQIVWKEDGKDERVRTNYHRMWMKPRMIQSFSIATDWKN